MRWLSMTLYLLLGLGLSGVYFSGLWITVRHLREAKRPRLLLLGSFLGRAAIVLVGFYVVIRTMGTQWEAVALALLGFMAGRWMLVRRWKPKPPTTSHTT